MWDSIKRTKIKRQETSGLAARRNRKGRRRNRGRFGFLYKLLSTLIIFAAILAGCVVFFRVNTMVVEGNNRYTAEEIIAAGKNRISAEQDFHNALAAATHNQFAMQLMQVVNKSIYLEVKYHEESTNLATHSIPDHREIVNFLRRRNPDGAKTAMQMHILHAIQSSQERKK